MQKRKLQVFVSSTFTDLIPERQSAVAAILKSGHIPAGMELFTAGDKSQLETIYRWIDESDVYMLILGGRYGSLEPNSGISYTELEYDYAYQQGKPLFAVVIREDALEEKVRASGSSVMETANAGALALFRDKVLSNVSSFFDDEKDIRLAVHESLADMRDNPSVKGWVSADWVEDTKPLHEEIARLRAEVARLGDASAKLARLGSEGVPSRANFDDVIKLLDATPVALPKHIRGSDGPDQMTLLNLFHLGSGPIDVGGAI